MKRRRILFMPDYGEAVGGGHVMRCLTIARTLWVPVECGFAVAPEGAAVIKRFGPRIKRVSRDWPADIAVIDGYDYTAEDERALTARGLKVCAFDDIVREHDCDLVIDSGLGRTAADYSGRAKILAGPDYCPVRGEFYLARNAALARRPGEGASRVLVSLGLTDVGGITERVVRNVRGLAGWSAMDVVLGAGSVSLGAVQSMAAQDPRIKVHVDAKDMASLCLAADFAIGAGGISQWERAVVGLPTVLVILAPNQASSALALAKLGAALALDAGAGAFEDHLAKGFERLAISADLRRRIAETSAALCDGLGAYRVARAIEAL